MALGGGGGQTDEQEWGVKTVGQMGEGSQEKDWQTSGLGLGREGQTDRQTAEESGHGGGGGGGCGQTEDSGRLAAGWLCRAGRRSPRGQGQAEGARGGGQRREAEAGRAAVFVELSAVVEL